MTALIEQSPPWLRDRNRFAVLTLRLPRPESLKPHRIPIKAGAQHREPEGTAST